MNKKTTANETKRPVAVIRKRFDGMDVRIKRLERETRSGFQKMGDRLDDALSDTQDLPILRDILQDHDEQLEQHDKRLKKLERKVGIGK